MISPELIHHHRWMLDPVTNEAHCKWCPLTLDADLLSIDGIREDPAPADEGRVGADLAGALREWKGLGESDDHGNHEPVVDVQGKPITPNWMLPQDRQHALSRVLDKKSQKTWEERELERFWLGNCDRLPRNRLEKGMKVLKDHMDEKRSEYRKEVRRFRESLGQ